MPTPDLILLGLNMPRKDGREVLADIAADVRLRHLPVIILITLSLYSLRASYYIVKRVNFERFQHHTRTARILVQHGRVARQRTRSKRGLKPSRCLQIFTRGGDCHVPIVTSISSEGPQAGGIVIDEREIEWRFVRASGPGGQNVNKVATAVQLRFDAARSSSLPEDMRARLIKLAGRRATSDGVLLIDARRYRTQLRNREDARDRLAALIQKAAEKNPVRKKTRPTAASKRRRLASKRHQGTAKRLRGKPDNEI